MKIKIHIIFVFRIILILVSQKLVAQQTILKNSNLPIILISTHINSSTGLNIPITDDPRVSATMKLIYRPDGSRNYLTDINNSTFLNYNGKITIETRGSSSQELPKKSYGFTTLLENNDKNNVSLLNFPSENDWVLNALAFDPSMIRDYLSYTLGNMLGDYSPRVKFVEVVVNNDYKGVYILTEKIKIDSDRVDLKKLKNDDNDAPDVTGGYIIKADKTTGGDFVAWALPNANGWQTDFLLDSPKSEDITNQQNNYIESVFTELALKAQNNNSSIFNGFPSIIDIPSFVDFMIMSEFTSNPDSYQFSTYFHKDKGGKLRAGPIWDYNLTFGNDLFLWDFDRSLHNVWQFDFENTGPKFWKQLFNNSTFKCYFSKRWNELTGINKALSFSSIENLINETVILLNESQKREQERWNTVEDQLTNIDEMKSWIQNRLTWIKNNIGSSSNCNNSTLPELVISKIHYHPLETSLYSSKKLEFLEITNKSNINVNLTGFYLKELGISYQFPVNSSIAANQKIYLCNDTETFENFYGFSPFGEYYRSLSNKTHKILLADAFGNTIDEVQYFDDSPWPTNADGFGYYLQLNNVNSDNNIASNWTIENQNALSSENNKTLEQRISVYPNPTSGILNFNFNSLKFQSLEVLIFNALGQTVGNFKLNTNTLKIDISYLKKGLYYYSIKVGKTIVYKNKIFKN